MIVDGKEIYPTSSESMSMQCPKCGDEGRRHVWVNTVVRGADQGSLLHVRLRKVRALGSGRGIVPAQE
jgi:hypothetical protein